MDTVVLLDCASLVIRRGETLYTASVPIPPSFHATWFWARARFPRGRSTIGVTLQASADRSLTRDVGTSLELHEVETYQSFEADGPHCRAVLVGLCGESAATERTERPTQLILALFLRGARG